MCNCVSPQPYFVYQPDSSCQDVHPAPALCLQTLLSSFHPNNNAVLERVWGCSLPGKGVHCPTEGETGGQGLQTASFLQMESQHGYL